MSNKDITKGIQNLIKVNDRQKIKIAELKEKLLVYESREVLDACDNCL